MDLSPVNSSRYIDRTLDARVRGWTITPSHFFNNQLDTVGLAE